MNSPEEQDFRQRWQRIESLVETLERIAEPEARSTARQLVQALLELHQNGLTRMMDLAAEQEAAPLLLGAWTRDGPVRSLLVLYGLHPVAVEQRVREAVERLRPRLLVRGADVELLAVTDSVVRLRIQETDSGYSVPFEDLCRLIETTLSEEVPDGGVVEFQRPVSARVPLPLIGPAQRG